VPEPSEIAIRTTASATEAGAVLRSLATLVRLGGIVAFQDMWPTSLHHFTAHLPVRSKLWSRRHLFSLPSGAGRSLHQPWGKEELPV
jgi:hypothetical protein